MKQRHVQFGEARLRMLGLVILAVAALSHGPATRVLAQTTGSVWGIVSEGYYWVGFSTESSRTYSVEYSTDFAVWQSLAGNLPGNGNAVEILDPAAVSEQAARFYRVCSYSGPGPGEPSGNPDPARLVWIPSGMFSMGSAANAAVRESDEGPLTVTLTKAVWMSRYEVTQGEYQAIMGGNPSAFAADPAQPVDSVRWSDATNYCARLTAQEQAAGRLPSGYTYRLPTEAEWEYACRAGATTSYSFGEDPFGTELGFYGWYYDNTGTTNLPAGFAYLIGGQYFATHRVGTRQPNAWGLYDFYGNVWEWCWDWYGSYSTGSAIDPTGPASGTARVIRGGSWDNGPGSCRTANRGAAFPAVRSAAIGFRTVLAH